VSDAPAPAVDAESRERLAGLLEFARGLLRARDKVLADMTSPGLGCFRESDVVGLPGITLDNEDGTWLRLKRLASSPPPTQNELIAPWCDVDSRDPANSPTWRDMLTPEISIEDASDLCEGGLLELDDIHELGHGDTRVRVVLRLANLTETRDAIEDWMTGAWAAWAETERPVRTSIALYERFFRLHGSMHGASDKPPELIWGLGLALLRSSPAYIDKPMLEQQLDLELEEDGTLVVMPRDLPLKLDLAPFHECEPVAAARAQGKIAPMLQELLESEAELTPFNNEEWEPLLRTASSLLAPDCHFLSAAQRDAGEEPVGANEILQIVSGWAIYARPRSSSALADDLERLANGLSSADITASVPEALIGLVQDLADTEHTDVGAAPTTHGAGGWSSGSTDPSDTESGTAAVPIEPGADCYFPLPCNFDQAQIISQLKTDPVVTVTGPPGTGKTHTIANIVAHYMATGRRVLVTARTAEAIGAVREKLPDELAVLVIASVGSDREGMQQLEEAVERLADEVVTLDKVEVQESCNRLEKRISDIDRESHGLTVSLAQIATANLAPIEWQGERLTAMEAAARVQASSQEHAWFDDTPADSPLSTLDETLAELKPLLVSLGDDFRHMQSRVPARDELPSFNQLQAAHEMLCRRVDKPVIDPGSQPNMSLSQPNARDEALRLHASLKDAQTKLSARTDWLPVAVRQDVSTLIKEHRHASVLESLQDVLDSLGDIDPGDLVVEQGDITSAEFATAVARACAGQRPLTRMQSMFNKALNNMVSTLTIDGGSPQSREVWARVRDALKFETLRPWIETAWADASRQLPLPALPPSTRACVTLIRSIPRQQNKIQKASTKLRELVDRLKPLFPVGLDIDSAMCNLDFDVLLRAIEANIDAASPEPDALHKLVLLTESTSGSLQQAIHSLQLSLGDMSVDDEERLRLSNAIMMELDRLAELAPSVERASNLLVSLSEAGAPEWAQRLAEDPANAESHIPVYWRDSWQRSLIVRQLERLDELGNGETLLARKRELAKTRQGLLTELIREKTLLGLAPRMTDKVKSSLTGFLTAAKKYGKGTGKKAPRWRKEMRRQATIASRATPVWVMPEYKIPEQLPSEIGSFDLVILDEASQCDVTSMAVLARGKRVLVVGDEMQVSPSSVGIKDDTVNALRASHLARLPARNQIDQETSIFDLTGLMYPSSRLMLREHFRCVEPIIHFSTRFYQGRLIPLRVPRASERMDPPLLDLHIEGAARTGKTNEAEAMLIVDEIVSLVNNPDHSDRSVAVISLLGKEQASDIEKRLIAHPQVGTEMIKRHGIICGDARSLQGQERSVVFLSMVGTPGTVRAQSNKDFQQRINVAMSRACDRMVLVRSVTSADLKPADLKAAVLTHFDDPLPDGASTHDVDMLDRCESGFERDVCEQLMQAGYRVQAQVKAGPFRIDLVVEGADDRRLAIELDGDRWHGPDVWHRDMSRQASLERAGWTFWRVFGSQWISHREFWWNDLVLTLERLGIEPLGAARTDSVFSVQRHYRLDGDVVRPLFELSEDDMDSTADGQPSFDDTDEFIDLGGKSESPVDLALTDETDRVEHDDTSGDEYELDEYEQSDDNEFEIDDSSATESDEYPSVPDAASTAQDARTGTPLDAVDFYDPGYQPHLARLIAERVDHNGPIDLDVLSRQISEAHGFRRTGRNIREAIHDATVTVRTITRDAKSERSTVWPEHMKAVTLLEWRPADRATAPDWDALSWPAQIGLVSFVSASNPPDLGRAVLEHLGKRKLTRRMNVAIEAAREAAEAINAEEYGPESNIRSVVPRSFRPEQTTADVDPVVASEATTRENGTVDQSNQRFDELVSMCRVILADGVISIDEARSLAGWLDSNRDQNLQWPADALDERLSRALDDDVLDTEEETELLEILTRITGDPTTIDHGHSRTALLSFDQPEPIVLMEGRTFCFIGRYLTGTLGTVERMTMKGGGETVSKVTSDLDYLVIGSIGSGDSIRSMHGIKIDKATRQRERDGATAIITEEAWHAALDSVLAIKAGSAR